MRVSLFLIAIALLLSSAVASEWLNNKQDVASLSKLINSLENTLPTDTLNEIEEEDDLALGATGATMGTGPVVVPSPVMAQGAPALQTGPTLRWQNKWGSIWENDQKGYMVNVTQSVATGSDTVIPIACSATMQIGTRFAACPTQLVIPAGSTKTMFTVMPVDNWVIDGTVLVTVSAVADSLITGADWYNLDYRFTAFEIKDDDLAKAPRVSDANPKCSAYWPTVITVENAGDTLANQKYNLSGTRGVYYCTYIGATRTNWAIGIRACNGYVQPEGQENVNVGVCERWQIWWNPYNLSGGGEIRYESLNLHPDQGINGPYQSYKGFQPTPYVWATTWGYAVSQPCLSVNGATGVDAKFSQFYGWEESNIVGLTRYRGQTDRRLVIVFSEKNTWNTNTGYWYITEDTSFTPWYKSSTRDSMVTASYMNGGKATGSDSISVTIAAAGNCPSTIPGTCVMASGSTNFQINQKYQKNMAATGRLTIFIGQAYTAYSISSWTLGTEYWSGYWFIGYSGKQIYYANVREQPVTSSYYPVTSDAFNQGTVKVVNSSC